MNLDKTRDLPDSDLQKENEELKKEVVNLKEAYMVAKGGPYKR